MKCQILFIGKNKKNISKCRLLKILPRVLSVKSYQDDDGRVITKSTGFTVRPEQTVQTQIIPAYHQGLHCLPLIQ